MGEGRREKREEGDEREAYGEPYDAVRVGRVAGAAGVLLVAEGADDDGVVERACGWVKGDMLAFVLRFSCSPCGFICM